jgi:hypothetical protein
MQDEISTSRHIRSTTSLQNHREDSGGREWGGVWWGVLLEETLLDHNKQRTEVRRWGFADVQLI